MAAENPADSVGEESTLVELIEEITSKLQAGEPVDLGYYRAKWPEHFERLRRLMPTVQAVVELGAEEE